MRASACGPPIRHRLSRCCRGALSALGHRGSTADSSRASLARAPPCAVQPWTYLASRFAAPVARLMALHGADAYDPAAALPSPLARKVFKRLPADQRARAALVCRRWRAALADPSLWEKLDLSSGGGVVCRVDGDVLRAAAARARGGLVTLAVTLSGILYAALLAVVAENATTLHELSLDGRAFGDVRELDEGHLLDLVSLAPALQTVTVADMPATGFLHAAKYSATRHRMVQFGCNGYRSRLATTSQMSPVLWQTWSLTSRLPG